MSNVVGSGIARTLVDADGDSIIDSTTGRLKVETEAEGFTQWTTYPNFQAATTTTALNAGDGTDGGLNVSITDAKEILIQTDDANSGFVMVGYSQGTTLAGSVGSRAGIKLNGGETLVLAISSFASIFLIGSASNQYVNVAYFA